MTASKAGVLKSNVYRVRYGWECHSGGSLEETHVLAQSAGSAASQVEDDLECGMQVYEVKLMGRLDAHTEGT